MIDWKAIEQYAYYADDRNRSVGEFWVDRSTRPRMWRLRHLIRGAKECFVIRIEKGSDLKNLHNKNYEAVRAMMVDGIESVAKTIGLKPRGKLRQLQIIESMKTSMVE